MEALLSPGGVVGIIGIIATGVAVALLGTVKALRDANDDLRNRVDDLEKARAADRAEMAAKDAAHELTRQDLESLKRVVTGEAHLVSIEGQLAELRRIIDRIWQTLSNMARHYLGGTE